MFGFALGNVGRTVRKTGNADSSVRILTAAEAQAFRPLSGSRHLMTGEVRNPLTISALCRSVPMPSAELYLVCLTNNTPNPLPLATLAGTESGTVNAPQPESKVIQAGQACELWLHKEQPLLLSWPLSRGVLNTTSTRTLPGSLLVEVVPACSVCEATASFAAALTPTITGSLWSLPGTPPPGSYVIVQGVLQMDHISICNVTVILQ